METWSHSNFQSENNTLGVGYISKVVLGISDLIGFIVTIVILGGKKLSWKLKWIASFGKFGSCGNGKLLHILLVKNPLTKTFETQLKLQNSSETEKKKE